MWDIEVDIACVGAGPSTLAGAVASADMGATVLLATPIVERSGTRSTIALKQRLGGFLGSWARPDMDEETGAYLTALSENFPSSHYGVGNSRMTVRTVSAMPSDCADAAFIGSRLRAWSATCLASPYGMIFSSVSGWRTRRMRAEDGQSLEVQPVGSISSANITAGLDTTAWLRSGVSARGLEDHRFTRLERIVFDDGRIVGIELGTSDGVLAVGIRRGLALSSGEPLAIQPPKEVDAFTGDLQLCLVGQSASRFLRVELLGTALRKRPACTASGRALREALRETRPLPSVAGRCGKAR